jgi:hypothetical protein
MEKKEFKYDVALSFAEEDDDVVRAVVAHLKGRGIKYYYYKEHEVSAWGDNMDINLDRIYQYESRFCVVFISQYYKVKTWTKYEIRKARRRAINDPRVYILPYRLDNTVIRDIRGKVNYLPAAKFDSQKLADAIYDKVQANRSLAPLSATHKWLHIFRRPVNIAKTSGVCLALLLGIFRKQVMPVDWLAQEIYDNSIQRQCAVCRDGTISYSHGRGTCSYHHGVDHYVDTILHRKTIEESREEAEQISIWH